MLSKCLYIKIFSKKTSHDNFKRRKREKFAVGSFVHTCLQKEKKNARQTAADQKMRPSGGAHGGEVYPMVGISSSTTMSVRW